jgi:hypothetical protein
LPIWPALIVSDKLDFGGKRATLKNNPLAAPGPSIERDFRFPVQSFDLFSVSALTTANRII